MAEISANDRRRMLARHLADVGVAAADPGSATARLVQLSEGGFTADGVPYELADDARVVLLGAGKASLPIAAALRDILGERLDGGVLVVRAGEAAPLPPLRVLEADHPLPTKRSLQAGEALLAEAQRLGANDVALCCFTGGSSALASVPPTGVQAEEKWELHRLLLRSGMPIEEINTVRKHVSALKGGRLAATTTARIVNLAVSDVVGDRLDVLTDLTVQDTTSASDAVKLLRHYGLWERVSASVRAHLSGDPPTPVLDGDRIQTVMLANGASVCAAMEREAKLLEQRAVIVSTTLTGESREAGRMLAGIAIRCVRDGTPSQPPIVLLGCGGETTVTLEQDAPFAAGGPNQEMALAAAMEIAGLPIAALFMDTDGSDGGTELAGGLVDGDSAKRAEQLAIDLSETLRGHRTTGALELLGDELRTGPTGTNVNDLFVIVVDPERAADLRDEIGNDSAPLTRSRRGRAPAASSSERAKSASGRAPKLAQRSRPAAKRSRAAFVVPVRRIAAPWRINARAYSRLAGELTRTSTASSKAARLALPFLAWPAAISATPSGRGAPKRRASARVSQSTSSACSSRPRRAAATTTRTPGNDRRVDDQCSLEHAPCLQAGLERGERLPAHQVNASLRLEHECLHR